jgi:hypothetical protein
MTEETQSRREVEFEEVLAALEPILITSRSSDV